MLLGVMYLLLFNPSLPQSILAALSPIIYITEILILVFGLVFLDRVNLGVSDLGVWGMGILAIVLILLGVFFYFASGFIPRAYLSYDAWFGIILVVLGLFAAFRARRRYGVFVYVR